MFPTPPYSGYTWRLGHHWGIVSEINLKQILLAAVMHSNSADPSQDINNYLVANDVLTPNVRKDSGQSDVWRDYQQMLSESGLIYSTEVMSTITPTPLGLALLEGTISFQETLTLQALRFQYPNGHHVAISSTLRRDLQGSPHGEIATLPELQQITGVQIRPTVLIWQTLVELNRQNQESYLTIDEIQYFLMNCANHADMAACVSAIIDIRIKGNLKSILKKEKEQGKNFNLRRRCAQEWLKFLSKTLLFAINDNGKKIEFSNFGVISIEEINEICVVLQQSSSFWSSLAFDKNGRRGWYAHFGNIPLAMLLAQPEEDSNTQESDSDSDEPNVATLESAHGGISLSKFEVESLNALGSDEKLGTITSSYSATSTREKWRAHDLMVLFIARRCYEKNAMVYSDSSSVDLLAVYQDHEFIIEVKSVVPKNFVKRVRLALGQVLHYDYLRMSQTPLPRRKVIALAGEVAADSWCPSFLNDHLDIDLLSLEGESLRLHSKSNLSHMLFTI